MTPRQFEGRVLNEGAAEGEALVLSEPLSFWGGFDPVSGRVVDTRHPQAGAVLAGRVLVLPESRGSGGTPAGVAEAIRRGTAPVGIVLAKVDVNIAAGAMVAAELYDRQVPIVALGTEEYGEIRSGDRIILGRGGEVTLERS